jgi:hypothetical protein
VIQWLLGRKIGMQIFDKRGACAGTVIEAGPAS